MDNSQVLSRCNDGSNLLFKVIPVKIHGKDRILDTYAFIDEGSNTSLIDLDLMTTLELQSQNSSKLEVKWFYR